LPLAYIGGCFGFYSKALGLEVYAKSYEKRQKAVDFKREDYEAQKERKGDSFFAGSDATVLHADYDAKKVDRLVDELKEQYVI
jgi:hypothetical protein